MASTKVNITNEVFREATLGPRVVRRLAGAMAEANESNAPLAGQELASLNEPTVEDLAREDEELARRIAEEQAAEAVGEGEEDEGPRDWQRFYMGYHEVRGELIGSAAMTAGV